MKANLLKNWRLAFLNDGVRIIGDIYNDEKQRFSDGEEITTSPVVTLDIMNGEATTFHTIYNLDMEAKDVYARS